MLNSISSRYIYDKCSVHYNLCFCVHHTSPPPPLTLFAWCTRAKMAHLPRFHVYSPTAHWSYTATAHWSYSPLVLRFHVYSPTAHWSYSPLVPRFHVYSPTAHWSYTATAHWSCPHWSYGSMSIVIRPTGPIGPTAHWSYSPLVLQPTGPTIRHLQYSVLFQYYLNMKMYLIHMKLIKLGIQGIGRSEKYRNL